MLTGRFAEEYPRESFIQAIEASGGQAATSELAEYVGCIRETAYKRMKKMEREGIVESRQFGRTLVWTVTDE